jgi:cyclohexadienyl dehydratase
MLLVLIKAYIMRFTNILISTFLLIFSTSALSESRLHSILKSGAIKVGTTGDWNPMTIKDPATNKYKGFEIDIVTQLALDMGVELILVPTEWKTLVNGIVSNKYDISTSASLSAKRALSTGYTRSYFKLATVPLTLKTNLDRFASWDDINKSGVKVAVTLGTTQEQQAKQLFPNAQLNIIESPARDFQEVLASRSDVHITSNIEAASLVKQYPELAIIPVKETRYPTPLAWLTPQDDQVWINYLNHWISLKEAQGFFDEMMDKYKLKSL